MNPINKRDIPPETVRLIAINKAHGSTLRELEAEFKISRPVLNRILSSDVAKAVIKGVIDDSVASAVIAVKRKLADLTELAMQTLEYHLKEEQSLEAVKIYLRGLGMDNQDNQRTEQRQAIQVILPGQQPIEVKSESN